MPAFFSTFLCKNHCLKSSNWKNRRDKNEQKAEICESLYALFLGMDILRQRFWYKHVNKILLFPQKTIKIMNFARRLVDFALILLFIAGILFKLFSHISIVHGHSALLIFPEYILNLTIKLGYIFIHHWN